MGTIPESIAWDQRRFVPEPENEQVIAVLAHARFLVILAGSMSAKQTGAQVIQTASPRHWIRVAAVYLLIPLLLLLCGGDFGWWQAWLYALMIFTAGIGGRVWAEQRHPGLLAERQNRENLQHAKAWDKVLAPLMAVSVSFPMVIVAGLDHRYGWSPDFPLSLVLIGFMLISLGYLFATWALAENRFFSSMVRIQTDRGHVVCDSGPYRFVRHPGYAGNIPALLGMVLALGTLWTLVPALVALVITLVRTVLEDRTLMEELPGYQEYARRVRYRLIPGIY
jgi:protein-S-isoprenylcysteine O-methyltransferase Ste14